MKRLTTVFFTVMLLFSVLPHSAVYAKLSDDASTIISDDVTTVTSDDATTVTSDDVTTVTSGDISTEISSDVVTESVADAATVTNDDAAVTPADADQFFEDGYRVQKNNLTIVNLHGTWEEMGRQYGALLADQLAEVSAFCDDIIAASEENAAKAESKLATQRAQMPYTIQRFFAGMEETSGLTMYQLECANCVERIAGLPHCSFAAAWDDYSAGNLIIGRNYDYGEIFQQLNHDVVITVFQPSDGSLAVATIGYAGEIYAVNAINEAGIFMELNNGTFSSNLKTSNQRITGTTQLLSMLFEVNSLELLDMYFDSSLNSSAYIINAADSETVHSYEWCTTGVERGDGCDLEDGLFVSTNHYISPEWESDLPDDETAMYTITRRDNLIALCEAQKGSIDAEAMMSIISTTMENGGAANDYTVYQLVAEPCTQTLWLKTVDQTEWTEFDLEAFFADKQMDEVQITEN